jgi:hypothetical protein
MCETCPVMAGNDLDDSIDLANTQRGFRWSVSYGVRCGSVAQNDRS